MGQAIQAQCKQFDFMALDFQAKAINLNDISAVIDFSSPAGFIECVNYCIEHNLPLISGTTGFSEEHLSLISIAKKSIPILIASNMSLGIANLKRSMEEYLLSISISSKCRIIEIHHTKKKDSPSGTALEISRFLENLFESKIDGLLRFNLIELVIFLECIELSLKMLTELLLFNILQIQEIFLQKGLCRLQDGLIPEKRANIALLTS